MYKKLEKRSQKLPGKLGECIFSHENPKSFWGSKAGPDPSPRYARFAHPTPLRYVGKIGRTRTGAPLDQILDLLLGPVWYKVLCELGLC